MTNIRSGWRKSGLYPYNRSITLDLIRKEARAAPTALLVGSPSQVVLATPYATMAIRQLKRSVQNNPSPCKVRTLGIAALTITTKMVIARTENRALREVVKMEKGKRTRGKPLGMTKKGAAGGALYGDDEIRDVLAANQVQEAKKAAQKKATQQKSRDIAAKRAEEALQKDLRKEERAEKAREIQAKKHATKLANQKRKEDIKLAFSTTNSITTNPKGKRKRAVAKHVERSNEIWVDIGSVPKTVTSTGRARRIPERYRI